MKKKKIITGILFSIIILSTTGCSSCSRMAADIKSDIGGGFNRTVNIYNYQGELIATYTGKIGLEVSNNCNKVKFDLDGKRYIYYNCTVETIADIE
jgi:hypothetical protein